MKTGNGMNTQQLSLTQIYSALMRQRYKALLTFLIVFCLVMGIFLLWPKSYGSEAKLHVQMARTETNLSPTVSSNGQSMGISIQDTRETEIKSVEEILNSRSIVEAVVKKVGPEKILENSLSNLLPSFSVPSFLKRNRSSDGDMSPEEYKNLKQLEQATNYLHDTLSIHNQKKTSVISVYAKASSPQLAQTIVNEIIAEVRQLHLKMHGVSGSSAFFTDRITESEKNLEEAMAELEKFRMDHNMLSVGSARHTLQEIINSLEKGIVDANVMIDQSQKKITSLKGTIAKTPEKIMLEKSGVERKSGDDATVAVFQLENERQRLLSQYQPSHPQVRTIDAQLKRMRSKLTSMKDDRTERSSTINQVAEDSKIQLVRAETENTGARARLASLEKKLKETCQEAIDINRAEIEADRLQRKIDDLRKDRDMYVMKGREAWASLSLDQSNLSTLVVAQQPTFILKHASPKGSVFLPIALMLGGLAGLATAMFYERNHLSPSLNEVDVEQILEMPILVTLPRVYSSRNMVN